MMRLSLLLLLILPGFAPVPATAQISTERTALTVLDQDYEALGWEAVGRLDTGDGFCSATLIAPGLVLSAAHCLFDRAGRPLAPEAITFHAGLRNGSAVATRAVSRLAAHPGFDPGGDLSARNIAHDLALLELKRDIPTHHVDPFALHGERVRAGPVSVVSYGQGRAEMQSRQRHCRLLERQGDVLLFDCDVTFGSSGAPVFSHLNGRGRILSVISGIATLRDGRRVAVGPQLPGLVADLKRNLRGQKRGPAAQVRRLGVGEDGATGAKFVRVD